MKYSQSTHCQSIYGQFRYCQVYTKVNDRSTTITLHCFLYNSCSPPSLYYSCMMADCLTFTTQSYCHFARGGMRKESIGHRL